MNQPGGMLQEARNRAEKGDVKLTEPEAVRLAGELLAQGRYKQAAILCRQITEGFPRNPDGHNFLGVALNALGDRQGAIPALRRATELAPKASSLFSNLGEILRQNGDAEDALSALKQAIRIDPANHQAHNNIGILYYDDGEYEKAVAHYRKALKQQPKFAEACNNLGNALRRMDDLDGAKTAYNDAIGYRDGYAEAYNNLGTLLLKEKKYGQCEHALRKAIALNPRYLEAYDNLASAQHVQDKYSEALRTLEDALKVDPDHEATLLIVGRVQMKCGNYPQAEQACRNILQKDADNPEALTLLGHIYHDLDRYDDAIAVLEQALAGDPEHGEALAFYGVALKSVGRLDEAREQILKALSINDKLYGAYATLNDLIDYSEHPELVEQIKSALADVDDGASEQKLPMHYAYAKALDDCGEHERALDYYKSGGALKRAQLDYDETASDRNFEAVKAAYPKGCFKKRPFSGHPSEQPLFILGMPRSGSTLVEQILSSHPDIYGAGEVKYLSRAMTAVRDRFPSLSRHPELVAEMNEGQWQLLAQHYLRSLTANAGESARVTDKLLTNYLYVGLIHLLFPNAKIINTRRNPVDTCLSGFTKLFKDDMPHSYDMGELGRYYRRYDALMAHWEKVLPPGVMTVVHYEDVVGDIESEAKRLIDFIGLPWNEACLDFHRSKRPVKTASVAQVRKPIYKDSVERWRKYGDGMQPLLDALDYKPG